MSERIAGYNMVMEQSDSTVVSEYTVPFNARNAAAYQSEEALEKEFIAILERQGYEYLQVKTEDDLVANLRKQLEKLNEYSFSDNEWHRFFTGILANPNDDIVEKTKMIQQDNVQVLKKDDGSSKNITLIDKKNIHKNSLQVINQYETNEGDYKNKYDVTVLVNGFPMVHIELKRRGVAIKEAFNQIDRYQRDSFWAGSGLYQYVHVFVISNGTHTKYYSNTTRSSHIKEFNTPSGSKKKTSNSFEFTSYWADAKNKIIPDLVDFARTFFAKHTILNILTKYCVFTTEDILLVMRPYQITATEKILNRIQLATNYKKQGTIEAGGYIWHSTGSGKTLTSFKTAQMAADLPYIDKVLFVVDRQDLDYQTMKEYDRFEKGAADGNSSTAVLEKQLSGYRRDPNTNQWVKADVRIIVTTIQKLSIFVTKSKGHPVADEKVVIIFDECHRSQFGEMHSKIVKFFKNYYLFGFTGTPIFAENATRRGDPRNATTPQLFGERLHTYTVVNAINDGNVLPFRIDYINTIKQKEGTRDEEVPNIDREKAMMDKDRIAEAVKYTLEHYDQKTKATAKYKLKGGYVSGFNSIFATASRFAAMKYYDEFQRQIKEQGRDLKVATIFTYSANEEALDDNGLFVDEDMDTANLDASSRDFLERVIKNYNEMFKTNYDTSSDKFQNYYKDISQRMKNRELDLLIVVNMFLTGFDATTLNTLWVDKNLKMHGLLQAFSRTNRILNSVKTYGNIICFRNLQAAVDESIALFGDNEASSVILLKDYKSYYEGYDEDDKHYPGYKELVERLLSKYPLGEEIMSEKDKKEFVSVFGGLLRVINLLSAFDQFEDDQLLSEREMQDYQSRYLDLYNELRKPQGEKVDIHDDVVFELELVKQIEVNIDYILAKVEEYRDKHDLDGVAIAKLLRVADSSMELRSKKALIEAFLKSINLDTDIKEGWKKFVDRKKEDDFQQIVIEEGLDERKARKFITDALESGDFKTTGTAIDDFMPPVRRFGGGGDRAEKKQKIIDKLMEFYERYFGM